MNKKVIIIIAAVIALGVGILLWRNSLQQGGFDAQVKEAESSQVVEESMDVKVSIASFSFKPQIIKVKKGTKVTWTNQDDALHTVTSDKGDALSSASLKKGDSYEKTFTETGEFRYHCTPHPSMQGVVIVE